MIHQQTSDEAKRRKQSGLPAIRNVARRTDNTPHPSEGGARGYDPSYRQDALVAAAAGVPVRPSVRSLLRWAVRPQRLQMTGNTGNVKITGIDLYHLIMYRLIYPECTADEMRRFIFQPIDF